jgi:pimeloyl-ACP methyl ester carboxylesterase
MKKRLFSIFLALIMVLTVAPLSMYANANEDMESSWDTYLSENPEEFSTTSSEDEAIDTMSIQTLGNASSVMRYSVLLLDTSGSMSGTPLARTKQAAIKFCEQVLAADGNSYVAIISFNTTATTACNFSDNLSSLTAAVNGLYSTGNTSQYRGLTLADTLLSNITATDAIKNIVLMSDGLPNSGESSFNGPYSSSDYSSYRCANAAYNKAQELKTKYNIYSLGFFHSLGGKDLAFGRRFMNDLQNAGYYDVVNPDDLDFNFGNIAEDIVGDDYPIIIIPGIMGSRLFNSNTTFDDSTKVWDPNQSLGGVWGLGSDLIGQLFVRPPEDQRFATNREYGAISTYQNVVDKLCDEFPNREIYLFSYDWRQDIALSADDLATFINTTLNATKVDLVCHSMGGLVAASYYSQYGEGKLGKVITAGTPYEGAPKLINSVQNWDILSEGGGGFTDNLLGGLGGVTKVVKRSFMAVAQLVPTENYFTQIPMWQDAEQWFNRGDYELAYDDYVDILREVFPSESIDRVLVFEDEIKASNGYNALMQFPNSYFSIGVDQPTIAAIKFQYSNVDVDQRLYESDLSYTRLGDGTVPYLSASITEQIENLSSNRWNTFATTHGGAIGHHEDTKWYNSETTKQKMQNINNEADKSLDWIVDIIKYESSSIPKAEDSDQGYQVIRIACPVDVEIVHLDESLVYSTESSDTSFPLASFGRMDVIGLNDEIKMFFLDESSQYAINIKGTDIGTMDYEFRVFNANNVLQEAYALKDIPITDNTRIMTGSDYSNGLTLVVDEDGDGSIEHNLTVTSIMNFTIMAEAGNGGTVSGGGSYTTGATVTLTATPGTNYSFSGWYENGTKINGADATYTFTATANRTLEARFAYSGGGGASTVTERIIEKEKSELVPENTEWINPFADVNTSDWFYDDVAFVVANGLFNGTSATTFAPGDTMTRAMLVTVLWRMAGSPAVNGSSFSDVPGGQWYSDAVVWAEENDIVSGIGGGLFAPDAEITREQMAAILYRYEQFSGKIPPNIAESKNFTDGNDTSEWATTAVTALAAQGIINGKPSDLFDPKGTATRAEVAAMLHRFIEAVK